jgi:MFS transporter, DHA1 family, multidrug resistance protein
VQTERWQRTLIALAFGQFITLSAFSFVFPFFPLYVQTLGIHGTAEAAMWAAAVISATAIAMAVSQPIWGSLSDRHGRRPILLRSMVGGAVVLAFMGIVSSVEQLVGLRFIQGLVSGSVAASNAMVATTVPKNRLGSSLGLLQVAFFVGNSAGPLLGGVMADAWGYRVPFYAAAVLMMVGFLVILFFTEEHFVPPTAGAKGAGFWADSRGLMAISTFPILVGIVFMIQLGGVVVSPVLSLFVADLAGSQGAGTAAGLVMAATGGASAVTALVLGRVGDRRGHGPILLVCLAGAAVTYFPQAAVQQVWQLLLLRVMTGAFLGGLMPSANALLAGVVPQRQRGTAFGLSASFQAMANFVGPVMGAGVASSWGIRAIFEVTGGLFVLACGWASWGFRRKPSGVADVGTSPAGSPAATPTAAVEPERD